MHVSRFGVIAVAVFFVNAACSETPEKACTPGKSESCAGEGACQGFQVCDESGAAFGPCVCSSSTADAGTDAGTDAGVPDAGSGTCNPLAAPGQQGCNPGQKCTWIVVAETPTRTGKLGCVPDGTAGLEQACTQGEAGETTGFDNCVSGAICINSECRDICGFDGSPEAACAGGGRCTKYVNLFANGSDEPTAGACTPTCDPVKQTASGGGTCGTNQGCYLLSSSTDTIAVCAGAGSVQHNQEITGPAFANSCLPGHAPRLRAQGSQVIECGALCAPANVTSTTNAEHEAGVAPYDCPTMSASSPTPAAPPGNATAGESCRYWWSKEAVDQLTPYSNTVGWCFKHAAWQYDSNGDGVPDAPFPRCTTLTTGDVVPPIGNPPHNDAEYFWCIELQPGSGVLPRPGPSPLRQRMLLDRLAGWRD